MRLCAVQDMDKHVGALEEARAALEASWRALNCTGINVCSGQGEIAAGIEGELLLVPTQKVVVAVANYKAAAGSVKSLVPKAKGKAKAKAKSSA